MKQTDKQQAIFGMFDGLTSSLGVVIALLLQHQSTAHLFNIIVGLSLSSGLSMGYGEWLADEEGNDHRALIMAGSTALGCFIPALPFLLFSGFFAYLWAIVIMYWVCYYVGKMRGRDPRLTKEVYYGVVGVSLIVILVEWMTGGIA